MNVLVVSVAPLVFDTLAAFVATAFEHSDAKLPVVVYWVLSPVTPLDVAEHAVTRPPAIVTVTVMVP